MLTLKKILSKPFLISIIFFILSALAVTIVIIIPAYEAHREDQEKDIYERARYKIERISYELYTRIKLNRAVSAYMQHSPDICQEEFTTFTEALIKNDKGVIYSTGYSPNFVVSLIAPFELNKKAIGFDLREKSGRKEKLQKSAETKEPYLEGPYQVMQGYMGLASFLVDSVFDKNTGNKDLVIVTDIIIGWDKFLEVTGLNEEDDLIEIAIRGKDGTGENGAVFYGDSSLFYKPESDIIKVPISLPLGEWVLVAYPRGGWHYGSITSIVSLSFVEILIFSLLIYLGLRYALKEMQLVEQKKYHHIMENINDIVMVVDINSFENIYVNRTCEKYTGYTPEEYLKLTAKERYTPDSYKEFVKAVDNVFGNEDKRRVEPYLELNFEGQQYTKWGTTNWVDLSAVSVKDKDGKFSEIISVTRIINERKLLELQLQESEERYHHIVENSKDLICLIDMKTMRFTYLSECCFKETGFTVEEHLQLTLEDILPPEHFKVAKRTFECAMELYEREGKHFETFLESQRYHKDGSLYWMETSIKVLNGSLVISIERNIEDRKKAEFLILDQKEELHQQKLSLEQQTKELEKANVTKDKFFSIIAHDLRNPFSSLLNMAEILRDHYDTMEKNTLKKTTELLLKSTLHIYRLLENLLAWSLCSRGDIVYHPTENNINKIIEDCSNDLLGQAADKNITIRTPNISAQNYIYCDMNMIYTVVRNLLSNAIKYSFENSSIEINVDDYVENSNYVRVSIKDSGVGISADNIDKLFKIDSKTSTLGTAKEKGTGLGLILCKEFIDKHNCKIWVESEVGKGTTFFFTLQKRG